MLAFHAVPAGRARSRVRRRVDRLDDRTDVLRQPADRRGAVRVRAGLPAIDRVEPARDRRDDRARTAARRTHRVGRRRHARADSGPATALRAVRSSSPTGSAWAGDRGAPARPGQRHRPIDRHGAHPTARPPNGIRTRAAAATSGSPAVNGSGHRAGCGHPAAEPVPSAGHPTTRRPRRSTDGEPGGRRRLRERRPTPRRHAAHQSIPEIAVTVVRARRRPARTTPELERRASAFVDDLDDALGIRPPTLGVVANPAPMPSPAAPADSLDAGVDRADREAPRRRPSPTPSAIARSCRTLRRPPLVGYHLRFGDMAPELRRLIAAGAIGEPTGVPVRGRPAPVEPGGPGIDPAGR